MRLFFYTLIGLSLGWWEGVVVVYLREILINLQPDLTKLTISQLTKPLIVTGNKGYSLLFIERTREIAPIVLIFCLSILFEKKLIRKLACFLWIFAIWDLFYYITLKILINWPPSLKTMDCLFLIPYPWIAPIWLPVSVMSFFILISTYIFKKIK
ncbi:MAG: hypothetical protein NC827_06905 [Candidatus Omnitrophica bacterium]|nr:hypothetical protein [Candidatus Omnitrophota bacterium]MCM8803019.1 hypothetical protein [Candidatus Omnitrophota bacterium]